MPRLSTYGIRASLIWLVVGAAVGAGRLALPSWGDTRLGLAHGAAMAAGGLTTFAMCTAWWILPKRKQHRALFGSLMAPAGLLGLQLGTLLYCTGAFAARRAIVDIGALLVAVGVGAFALALAPRVAWVRAA